MADGQAPDQVQPRGAEHGPEGQQENEGEFVPGSMLAQMAEVERAFENLKAVMWREVTPPLERAVRWLSWVLTGRHRDPFGRQKETKP